MEFSINSRFLVIPFAQALFHRYTGQGHTIQINPILTWIATKVTAKVHGPQQEFRQIPIFWNGDF